MKESLALKHGAGRLAGVGCLKGEVFLEDPRSSTFTNILHLQYLCLLLIFGKTLIPQYWSGPLSSFSWYVFNAKGLRLKCLGGDLHRQLNNKINKTFQLARL